MLQILFLTEIALSSQLCFLKRCYGVLKTCIYRTRNDEMADPLPGLCPWRAWTPMTPFASSVFPLYIRPCSEHTRNSSGDEIANVNFLYDDIIHALGIQ